MRAKSTDDPGETIDDLKDDIKGFAEADLATLLSQLAAIRKDITGIAAAIGSVELGQVESLTETMRGAFDHATAGLKGNSGDARRRGEDAAEEVEAMIARNPLVSLLLALGLGFLAGMLTPALTGDQMELFRGLAESAKQEVARNVRIVATKLMLGGLGFLAALAAIVFFFAALMTELTERFGELIAELIVGGVFAVLALILFIIAARISRRTASPAVAPAADAEAARAAPLPAAIAAFAYGFARGVMRKRR